ncbi:hypothetical protein BC940DRAFT_320449 [Gongronella butleri]|nr:hypothetical protein BC940DRAFT_320449 [Gongronella butleri]
MQAWEVHEWLSQRPQRPGQSVDTSVAVVEPLKGAKWVIVNDESVIPAKNEQNVHLLMHPLMHPLMQSDDQVTNEHDIQFIVGSPTSLSSASVSPCSSSDEQPSRSLLTRRRRKKRQIQQAPLPSTAARPQGLVAKWHWPWSHQSTHMQHAAPAPGPPGAPRAAVISPTRSHARSPDTARPEGSTPVAPWLLINQVVNEIHRLQCMIDIEKQLIDDAQRDMVFYSQLLAQLDNDVEILFKNKVWRPWIEMESLLLPLAVDVQDWQQPLTRQLDVHETIVTRFTNFVYEINITDVLPRLATKATMMQQDLVYWNRLKAIGHRITLLVVGLAFAYWLIFVASRFTAVLILLYAGLLLYSQEA